MMARFAFPHASPSLTARLRRLRCLLLASLLVSTAAQQPTFTTIATSGAAASGGDKYHGAAAVGSIVYFVPYAQHNVGILDTRTDLFSTVATTGAAADGVCGLKSVTFELCVTARRPATGRSSVPPSLSHRL